MRERLAQRAEAEGRDFDELANEVILGVGLSEGAQAKWQNLVKRGRTYSREMTEAKTDEDAIQIAVEAVHKSRADQQHGGR